MLGIKGGGGKIGGGGGGCLGLRTSSSSTFGSIINTHSRSRSDKSRFVSLIIGSTKGSFESSKVGVLRNDVIGFGGSGSIANMFIYGGLEEAPTIGSRGWYNGSLSFFLWKGFILWSS